MERQTKNKGKSLLSQSDNYIASGMVSQYKWQLLTIGDKFLSEITNNSVWMSVPGAKDSRR